MELASLFWNKLRFNFIFVGKMSMVHESKNKAQPGSALLVLFLMALAVPAQAEVYKWVDENGRAHYTDKPPKQGEHTQLRTQAAAVIPQDESVQTDSPLSEDEANRMGRELHRQEMVKSERFKKERAEKERAEREKFDADQQRYREKQVAQQSARDSALIDECKRNREVYCDKGLDKIKDEQEMRRIEQEEDRKRARNNPVIPRYTGNDIYIR